jgi:uncharacterized protein (TIGR01244 family)
MKHRLLVVLLLLCLTAQADETGPGVHVDLDKVVQAGKVEPVDGITSAGQPDEKALKVFAESGYSVVIDMRGPDEDRGVENFAGVVEASGMKYVAFPVSSQDDINFDTAKNLDALLQGVEGPVLIHCGSGNRVGAVLALRESLAGADDETALQYGRNAGMTRLEPAVRAVLESD